MQHITVLKTEAVDALNLKKAATVVDATFGAGGHGSEICKYLGSEGTYIAIDADETAFTSNPFVEKKHTPQTHFTVGNFSNLETILRSLHITHVDAILADLGWRTDQFTDGGKGFSFASDEPLAMTYGDPENASFTAADIVNSWKEEDIANVLYGYGEERYSRRIARAIIVARAAAPILTAKQLADVITASVPASYRHGRIHPATKSFQALRIAVNDELSVLEVFLEAALTVLAPEGRLAIITFHSLEDRIVKQFFRTAASEGRVQLITKKPLVPSDAELKVNPRARSAKLRIIAIPAHHE